MPSSYLNQINSWFNSRKFFYLFRGMLLAFYERLRLKRFNLFSSRAMLLAFHERLLQQRFDLFTSNGMLLALTSLSLLSDTSAQSQQQIPTGTWRSHLSYKNAQICEASTRFVYSASENGFWRTNDFGETWYPANRGYNVTQFYGIAFDSEGAVMGGAQDSGTSYNDHSLSTFKEFREVNGGDGFACEISFYNPKVMFSSVYYNSISRSGDRGYTRSSFVPSFPSSYDPAGTEGSIHPFVTSYALAEYYDLNSEDSVLFVATKNYAAGTTIKIASKATGDSMTYTTPTALYFDDTLEYDPSLTTTDYTCVNTLNGQTVYLGNYP